tara:strand:+ start:507 stop:614 length:108 start_codon:yes stop_codon:yes gene_type:complete
MKVCPKCKSKRVILDKGIFKCKDCDYLTKLPIDSD